MQEFPFAWWYKCIMLHSAKISADNEVMHCSEWRCVYVCVCVCKVQENVREIILFITPQKTICAIFDDLGECKNVSTGECKCCLTTSF
jgi:hypothetical protein